MSARSTRSETATRRLFLRFVLFVVVVLTSGLALADSRIDFLADRLKNGDDVRVRIQAALSLGASDSDAAVDPLCGGLANDSSDVVRHACAVALKRLARSSALPCLHARLDTEPVESVKVQIQRTIESLEGGGGGGNGGGGAIPAGSRFYIAVGLTTNNTSRPRNDIDRIVQAAIRSKLSSMGGYAFAPPNEAPGAANQVINANNLKGYYLGPVVSRFEYNGGTLKCSVKLTVFTYPGRDFKGEATSSTSIDGVQQGDSATEDQLLDAAIQSAAGRFAGGFH